MKRSKWLQTRLSKGLKWPGSEPKCAHYLIQRIFFSSVNIRFSPFIKNIAKMQVAQFIQIDAIRKKCKLSKELSNSFESLQRGMIK